MPNGTTTILPSPLGGGLTRGAQGFVQARELNRQNALRQRRADLEERTVDIQEQGIAFNRLLQLGPLITPGTSLKQNPFLAEIARTAFQDLDDSTFDAVLDMQLNPETVQTLIAEQQKFFFQKLDPENEEDAKILEDIGISGLNLGARSRGELELQGRIVGLTGDALSAFETNPTIQGNIARGVIGLEPTVRIPGLVDNAGEEIEFESIAVANLYGSIVMNRLNNFTDRLRLDQAAEVDIVKELMDLAVRADIGLGRPKATEIVNAYAASVDSDVEEGSSPFDLLLASSSPDVQRAMRLFIGTIRLGDSVYEDSLRQSDDGNTILLIGAMGEFFSDKLGIPIEDSMGMFQEFLDNQGSNMRIRVGRGFSGFGRRRFTFESVTPTDNRGASILPPDADRETVVSRFNLTSGYLSEQEISEIVSAFNILKKGDISEDSLRALAPARAVDLALTLIREEIEGAGN